MRPVLEGPTAVEELGVQVARMEAVVGPRRVAAVVRLRKVAAGRSLVVDSKAPAVDRKAAVVHRGAGIEAVARSRMKNHIVLEEDIAEEGEGEGEELAGCYDACERRGPF
jgi:uncharacterized protein (DUF362 family)